LLRFARKDKYLSAILGNISRLDIISWQCYIFQIFISSLEGQNLSMQKESRKEREKEQIARSYEILSRVKINKCVYVRDDQYEFPLLLDSARTSRKKGHRFGLIDSGKLDCVQLEWLAQEGADLYTSDETRPKAAELIVLNKACKKGAAIMAYFHHRDLETAESENLISFFALKEMGRSGIFIHLSNKEKKRENSFLSELASYCRRGGSWLIYYHHRELFPQLEDLAGNGAWIHVSDRSLKEDRDLTLF